MTAKAFTKRRWTARAVLVLLAATLGGLLRLSAAQAAPLSGAIFTTNGACDGTNVNIFASKDTVFLDGGPAHPGAAGLPDGSYYVKVTEPSGTLLGSSPTAAATVVGGEFAACYQLSAILVRASDATPGYDTTTNGGGEYKVWISPSSTFDGGSTKTDNFKVESDDGTPGEPASATLNVTKFYDANANGINDDNQPITGWQVHIQDGIDYIRYTPVQIVVEPDLYTVTESTPVETNWVATTENPVQITLATQDVGSVEFGNLCLGAGGGSTLGFWSNKNGQALVGADDRALLAGLNLRNPDGSNFDAATNAALKSWLLNGNAVNMASMLSVQLTAMQLNVFNGKVSGSSLIYAPGTASANALGYATVAAVMAEANASLGTDAVTVASGPARTLQQDLKNALDAANNNTSFVQSTPCAFSFATV